MGDTGSERSKPPSNVIPPRCPCGFWGSSKTMNLCSKCFADIQKKQPDEDCASEPASSSSNSQSAVFCTETSSSSSQTLSSGSEGPSTDATPLSKQEVSSTETARGTLSTPSKRPCDSVSGSESEASPEKRVRVGESSEESQRGPKQKNRRRCHRCQTKLELVQQELGSCRCGYVFCMLHRLPEQHDCLFDHLGRGREEAVLKMVKLDRKLKMVTQTSMVFLFHAPHLPSLEVEQMEESESLLLFK
ncbi:AN1-type zinc finger protein 3 isoform X2 [Neoarius graeffei]|uniref:AN1-type zinc finger protein 3 isoform X2 n=1 Tax=Neoarius graeffei TaxID=443677 RepID=UPI00298C052C|nr:AN1-type zinc finger protein 3 isoform X2 [Neoarius graeffei]